MRFCYEIETGSEGDVTSKLFGERHRAITDFLETVAEFREMLTDDSLNLERYVVGAALRDKGVFIVYPDPEGDLSVSIMRRVLR